MPRATLTFKLPEEEPEHRNALEGAAAKALLWDIDQHCRSIVKHGDPSDETRELAELIRRMIYDSSGVTME